MCLCVCLRQRSHCRAVLTLHARARRMHTPRHTCHTTITHSTGLRRTVTRVTSQTCLSCTRCRRGSRPRAQPSQQVMPQCVHRSALGCASRAAVCCCVLRAARHTRTANTHTRHAVQTPGANTHTHACTHSHARTHTHHAHTRWHRGGAPHVRRSRLLCALRAAPPVCELRAERDVGGRQQRAVPAGVPSWFGRR
jgi:hypothetical protein